MNKLFYGVIYAISAVACIFGAAAKAGATDFLVKADLNSSLPVVWYNSKSYVPGVTAFSSYAQAYAVGIPAGSNVQFAPGTYSENITVNVNNVTLLGSNANVDSRASDRTSPTILTGTIDVQANGLTINGFNFRENGCVRNTTATPEAPIKKLTFIYNKAQQSTLSTSTDYAVIRLGKIYTNATAASDAAQNRYININISHNTFTSAIANRYILIAGAGTKFTCTDNKFVTGGQPIRLDNATGTINITHNTFKDIGALTSSDGGTFCVSFNRCGYSGTTDINILGNSFDNCCGETSLYPVIRFYPGAAGADGTVNAVNASVNINYNLFKNKTQIHADYNYLYYADKGTTPNVKTDLRFNTSDNTSYCYAFCTLPGQSDLVRQYADNYELIDPSKCTFSTHKSSMTTKAATVLQSFDIDAETGDVYTIQVHNGTSKVNDDPAALTVSRIPADGSTSQSMTLTWAGHGTNMKVARVNGKVNIFCGGKAELKADGSETKSTACCWFRFVNGATVDCRKSSFTYNSTTYPITFMDWDGKSNEYPALDEVNRLFCSRTTGTDKNYFAIYDLDDVLANGTDATQIRTLTINKGVEPTSGTGDNGYNTWDHQGYAIAGDYLYIMEGVCSTAASAVSSKPTCYIHIHNWRTNTFVKRMRLSDSAILSQTHGEIEGCTVRRLSTHTALYCGFAIGNSGARKVNIFEYKPKDNTSNTIAKTTLTPDNETINFTVSSMAAVTSTIKTTNANLHGPIYADISGPDAEDFAVKTSNTDPWKATSTFKVTYTPREGRTSHSAFLRVTSPGATDLVVPITASNLATTDINDIESDALNTDCAPVYYNLQGMRVDNPVPGRIYIRMQGGKATKIIAD